MKKESKVKKIFDKCNLFILAVCIVKLVLMGLMSSDYQDKLFIPFVSSYLEHGGNPYNRFYKQGEISAFPYSPVMLWIQCTGMWLIKTFGITNLFLRNFLFKLPSFVLDFVGYHVLKKIFPDKRRYIAVFYYGSPIILYSVYMHGQLDIIPMVMLLISISYLISKKTISVRYLGGTFFSAIALLCKLHILAVVPIVFLYLIKRDHLRRAMFYLVIVASMIMCIVLPFMTTGFLNMVLLNKEQGVLTNVYFTFYTVRIYIPIMSVWLLYLSAYKINTINRRLFLSLCGIVFAVFLVLCPPMPGWYVWIVPFVALFFASINREKYKNIGLYAVLNVLYLLYFVFLHDKGMVDIYIYGRELSCLKYDSVLLRNGVFTLMSGVLLHIVYSMYHLGVASNSFYLRKNIPFTIGIAGDSGAGKSTMIGVVEKTLGQDNLLYIEGDGDHRWERGDSYWDEYTALNPKANYLYQQAKDLQDLRTGISVRRSDYDHSTGKFTSKKRIVSKKFVMLCGLHALYLPQTRKHIDLKIYIDTDEKLRRYWKIQRDTIHRGHSKEAVIASIEERMPDAVKYIYPQKEYADLIIRYYDKDLVDCMVDNHQVKLCIMLTIGAEVDIEMLANELIEYGIEVEYNYSEDLEKQIVKIESENLEQMQLPVERIAQSIIPQIDEISGESFGDGINAKDGVVMLFLLLLLSTKMQGEVL